jgi:DNA-directed RNA polymerase specialized sigma24 family protein
MKAWANRDQFDQSKSFQSWVIQIAKNISIDWKRKRDRRPETVNLYDAGLGGEDDMDGMAALAIDYPSWQDGEYMDIEVLVRDSTERVRKILEKAVRGEPQDSRARSCLWKWRRKVRHDSEAN